MGSTLLHFKQKTSYFQKEMSVELVFRNHRKRQTLPYERPKRSNLLDNQGQLINIDAILANHSTDVFKIQHQKHQHTIQDEQSFSIIVPEPNVTESKKESAFIIANADPESMPQSIHNKMIVDQNIIAAKNDFNVSTVSETENGNLYDIFKKEMPIRDYHKIKCQRSVFICSEEQSYMENEHFLHYLLTAKTFHQNIDKNSRSELPRKKIMNHWDALESIVYVKNKTIEVEFNEQKAKFSRQVKVDKYGKVPEYFLFHGTANENINIIIEDNFDICHNPDDRSKSMLFGRGVYLSQLPGVSLMYGEGLLMCKVILGKCQKYYPNGQTPPPIPDGYDSRIVIKDGMEVVCVVKNPSQILPYSIINIKPDRVLQSGTWSMRNQEQEQPAQVNSYDILARG